MNYKAWRKDKDLENVAKTGPKQEGPRREKSEAVQ